MRNSITTYNHPTRSQVCEGMGRHHFNCQYSNIWPLKCTLLWQILLCLQVWTPSPFCVPSSSRDSVKRETNVNFLTTLILAARERRGAFMQVGIIEIYVQLSVPQIEYPLGGSSKKGILPVASFMGNIIVLSNCTIVWYMFDIWPDVTIVHSDITIVVPWQHGNYQQEVYMTTFFATAP